VPSGFSTPSATSQIRINGAQSLQPAGLRPAPSLSTLNPRRYRREPKTRYGMCWVDTFPVALAATSSGALRGAPKTKRYSFDADAVREPYQSVSLTRLQRAVGPTHKHFQGAPGQTPQGLHAPRAGRPSAPHPTGRNKRCVWTIAVRPFHEAHFATFPSALVETPIKAGCPPGGIVLDPFVGSGTTAVVARALGRRYIGIELNPDYIAMANHRLQQGVLWAASPGEV
jgi:hypothetical protein